ATHQSLPVQLVHAHSVGARASRLDTSGSTHAEVCRCGRTTGPTQLRRTEWVREHGQRCCPCRSAGGDENRFWNGCSDTPNLVANNDQQTSAESSSRAGAVLRNNRSLAAREPTNI